MIELKGKRVVLRALERQHCRELWEKYEPTEPFPTEPLNPGLSVEGADRWFEEIQAQQGKDHLTLGVFSQEGALLGDIQLSGINWRDRSAALGLGIASESNRKRGYGTDAALTLIDYGFEHLGLYRVTARTTAYNAGAKRVLEKCGFVLEGVERQARFCSGQRWDVLIYGLLQADFKRV